MANGENAMTMPINNFQDILDAMGRDPALREAMRRHILTDELLQVPAHLERIEGDIGTLKEDVTALKEGQARIEGDIGTLKEDVGTLKEDVGTLKEDVAALKEGQARIGGGVSRLTGTDYESHVAVYIHRGLHRSLGINAAVFSTQRDKSSLTELLDQAESQGIIEPGETDELDRADLVLTTDGPTDYLLAEISITVQQDDIDKATERARLLAKATGRTVTPFVVGAREEPGLRREHVEVILIPERQTQPQNP